MKFPLHKIIINMNRRAQSVIEYALLIAVVTGAFAAMKIYVQRAVNANVKVIEEQINAQPQ